MAHMPHHPEKRSGPSQRPPSSVLRTAARSYLESQIVIGNFALISYYFGVK